ncbi:glycosyltransferase family 10 domain-containing protein [Chitinophaga eiseniae]|uniref:Fucosyltransferase C-terminal domain-containing protein n=1 Tax=Chitinophaga eiseniae TaxID=634771 RepID=A0A847SKX2_9BACT|nr:glycosyltransferase family 10 [Chitinophaga eiseniae]NLR78208.1 hypothetical protein [Chitinophaga eiseniae]
MKIKVRVTCFWEHDKSYLDTLKRYGRGKLSWKNVEFVADDNYDRLIILTRPHKDFPGYDSGKAITFLTEPPASPNRRDNACVRTEAMYLPLPFWPAEIYGARHHGGNGIRIQKTKLFSCVTSDLNFMEGHFHRLQMVNVLDQLIEEGLDIWGKNYGNSFHEKLTKYKGEIVQKYDGLWPYKYHFISENSFENGYFTEKIVDPLITETLCFYDGCQNLEEFIDERAFVRVNVKEPLEAAARIIEMIQNNEYRQRIKYIKQQKKRFLTDLNPLNIIWMAVNDKDVLKECLL